LGYSRQPRPSKGDTITTATTKTRKPAAPKTRSVKLHIAADSSRLLLLTIGDDVYGYRLDPIASDFGAAFHLSKYEVGRKGFTEEYEVNINGTESSCSCPGHSPGHTYRGHCKHTDALNKLQQLGKL
jgi:hypothetical protein